MSLNKAVKKKDNLFYTISSSNLSLALVVIDLWGMFSYDYKFWLCWDILAVAVVWSGTLNYEREESWSVMDARHMQAQIQGWTDVKVEIVM